jgi:hypothetical protein
MRSKRLKHYVDVACHMFMGWRLYADLEKLSEPPKAKLEINLLTGTAFHSALGLVDLQITKELVLWLQQESEKDGIELSQLTGANLVVDIISDVLATDRKKVICFSFQCKCTFVTAVRTYIKVAAETHKYHYRT